MRVLVAEDDRQMSQLLCAMLRGAGHQPSAAYDGASTMMAAVRAPQPEVIVLDLGMPAGTGQATLAKLRQSSKTTMIPVLVVTAAKDQATKDEVRGLGASAFLEKPVNPDNFIAVVEALGPPE
jgi:DNA-binding response OmpR family regulator